MRLEFDVQISAPITIVWFVLWDDWHYRQWTTPFCEGSYAVSDWKEGSTVHFLDPKGSGMYSKIVECQAPKRMSFQHIGEMKDFQEQPLDQKTQAWSGATESYDLSEKDGVTNVKVTLELGMDEHQSFFNESFPKALAVLKEIAEHPQVKVSTVVNASLEKVWDVWVKPEHIVNWNFASDDWCCPSANNDLQVGGKFVARMEAKDGSSGFDFNGIYSVVKSQEALEYVMEGGRKVQVMFTPQEGGVLVTEIFEPENVYPLEMQQGGWQSILENFKKYGERN